MLNTREVLATIAVRDLPTARRFYEDTLGLSPVATEGEEAVTYRAGSSQLLVYQSAYAGTNQATSVTWVVGDEVDPIVKALKTKGVAFEHYDFPGMMLEGDVHVMGELRNAWFKDPDGNIISIVNGRPSTVRS